MNRYIIIAIAAFLYLTSLAVYQYTHFNDGRLHIVFCDVGQGDGIFITTPEQKQILIDGGPDKSILDCLSRHMPFWDRSIDLVVMTHPHQDHFQGASYVIDRYVVGGFVSTDLSHESGNYKDLKNKISEFGIPEREVFAGDRFKMPDEVVLEIEGPDSDFLKISCINGIISNCSNQVTLIMLLKYGDFNLLLTGDNETEGMVEVLDFIETDIEVMQVPHHGSASGLDSGILDTIDPDLAVISVGANNRHGHPRKEILELLEDHGIKILRTDLSGSVEIVSDGKMWFIQDEN